MANKVRPIRPSEVAKRKKKLFPSEVLESFNELIAAGCSDGSVTIEQKEVVALMMKKGLKRGAIFNNNWLDVEEVYEAAGWRVEYDKPAYNEDYEPKFTFSRRR